MNKPYHYRPAPPSASQPNIGIGWIILLCLLWTLLVPIPGPIDDLVVWAYGAYSATRGLRQTT